MEVKQIKEEVGIAALEKMASVGEKTIPSGPAAAMTLAAGIGCAVYGVVVLVAAGSKSFADALSWIKPVGPLCGKTSIGVAAWLLALGVLYPLWRNREVRFGRVWVVTLVLLTIGFALTFPPIYDLAAPK